MILENLDRALQLAAPALRSLHTATSTQYTLKEGSFPTPLTNRTRSSQVHGSSCEALSNFLSNFAEWVEETQLSAFSSSISF